MANPNETEAPAVSRAAYVERGWARLDGVLTSTEVELLRNELMKLARAGNPTKIEPGLPAKNDPRYPNVLQLVHEPSRRSEIFRRFASNTRLGELVRDVTNLEETGVRLYKDTGFIKPPTSEGGLRTGFHQDLPFMSADRKGACTLWIALVDLSEDAGTLQFVEGSQEWGPLGRFDQLDDDWVEDHRDAHVRISHAQSLAAGDATLHDALTLHGAGENRSGISRVVYSLTYMPANTLYNGMPHRATDGLNLDLDKPFGGDLFPLVAEPIP